MFPQALDVFSFSSWYHDFERLTFPSRVISLPKEFLEYLSEDGIKMPPGLGCVSHDPTEMDDELNGDGPATDWTTFEDEEDDESFAWLPELKQAVDVAIAGLGGSVVPKLNWSAPKDASWILPNRQLKCTSFADILLLLKASTFVSYDVARLSRAPGPPEAVTPELVLRQWHELNPGWEFRCFVSSDVLIGISQRYCSAYYPHLSESAQRLVINVKSFFLRRIRGKFGMADYVFDIVTLGPAVADIRLLDFNPFSRVTDGILFSWEELAAAEDIPDDELLRYVMTPVSIQPDEMRQYEIPSDFSDRRFTTNGQRLFDYLDGQIVSQSSEQ